MTAVGCARLTAGDAEYEGVIQWTGDLGVGVRAARPVSRQRDDEATGSKQLREVFYRHSNRGRAARSARTPGMIRNAREKMPHAPTAIGANSDRRSRTRGEHPGLRRRAVLVLVGALGVITFKNPCTVR